jgi:hypothetical protein
MGLQQDIEQAVAENTFLAVAIQARDVVLRVFDDNLIHGSEQAVNSFQRLPKEVDLSQFSKQEIVDQAVRRFAAIEALGHLYADGLVCEVSMFDNPHTRGPGHGFEALDFRIRNQEEVFIPLPKSPHRGKRNTRRVGVSSISPSAATALDLHQFQTDLASLALDARTLRALAEAFEAFRVGMPLATALLAGTVVEGAVKTLARLLLPYADSDAAKKLVSSQLLTVKKPLLELIRSSSAKQLSTRADQLSSHLNRFINIRNYGAHTGGNDPGLEYWLANPFHSAVLLSDCRHVLLELKSAIDDFIETKSPIL